jgi:hypothetical protein
MSAGVCYADACSPHIVGSDTSSSIGPQALIFGADIGETFEATDTLIESITVWRPAAEDTSFVGLELFIVGTDSLGHPNVSDMLLQNKVAYNYYGDGVHDIPITFTFDPPFALPSPGKYEFAVQLVPCSAIEDVQVSGSDVYPGGDIWLHGRAPCGVLRADPLEGPNLDMIFSIVFCDHPVGTRTETWGSVKARYR